MPKFKSVEFVAKNDAGAVDKFTVSVEISSSGDFYAHVPDKLLVSFNTDRIDRKRHREGFFATTGMSTFEELVKTIRKAHKDFMKPIVTEEPVIRYNIESHVSFAVDEDGRIFPNASFPGANWLGEKAKVYGNHHARKPSKGGYSLIVGAKAVLKTTTTYGDKFSVKYNHYYKGGSHLGHENPAQLLNSWASMDLPEDAREMPYSDHAAMFFYGLMQAMAELNRRIQEFTKTPERIALAISKHNAVLMLEGGPK